MKHFIYALTAAALTATGAQATTFNTTSAGYAAQGTGGCAIGCNFQEYTVDGIVMTVSAGIYTDTASAGGAVVTPNGNDAEPRVYSPGTGVDIDSGNGLPNDQEFEVDGNNGNEVLILSFDEDVQLVSALFASVGFDDDFDFFMDTNGDGVLERLAQDIDIPNGNLFDFFAFDLVGKLFGIGASGFNDEWKLSALTVRAVVSDVPLPAALPLFIAGLAGFGFAARRKQRV
jgi:hypothetical protein